MTYSVNLPISFKNIVFSGLLTKVDGSIQQNHSTHIIYCNENYFTFYSYDVGGVAIFYFFIGL